MKEAKKECLGGGKGRRRLGDKRKVWHMGKPEQPIDKRKASWRLWRELGQFCLGKAKTSFLIFSTGKKCSEIFKLKKKVVHGEVPPVQMYVVQDCSLA